MSKELDQPSDQANKVDRLVHTPGPWEVAGPSQNGHCRRIFAGDEYVAIVGGSDKPMKTIRANADLVAAAPELLEALIYMRRTMYSSESEESVKADAAIAKALGNVACSAAVSVLRWQASL